MNPTTAPGDIPGLIHRTAPLRYYGYRVVAVTDPHNDVLLLSDGVALVKSNLAFVALDLSLPAGCDIAARWMAERLGLECGLTAPTFDMNEHGVWVLTCGWEPLRRWFFHPDPDYGCGSDNWTAVPGLPKDRAQGIEAMRLCVLHLAGRSP